MPTIKFPVTDIGSAIGFTLAVIAVMVIVKHTPVNKYV